MASKKIETMQIACEQCGGIASLARAVRDARHRPLEFQVFECLGCSHKTLRSVRKHPKGRKEL
jgi:DNA-directed RNA polymerase subunit RPC12/RpoP